MRPCLAVLTLFELLCLVRVACAQSAGGIPERTHAPAFRPAVLRGVTMGVSSEADVLRILGPPSARVRGAEDGGDNLVYYGIGPLPGKVEFAIAERTKKVAFAEFRPTAATVDELKRAYGPGWILSKWKWAHCPGRAVEDLVYRDPGGDLVLVEYPKLGIVIHTDATPAIVEYRSEPIGKGRPPCPEEQQRK